MPVGLCPKGKKQMQQNKKYAQSSAPVKSSAVISKTKLGNTSLIITNAKGQRREYFFYGRTGRMQAEAMINSLIKNNAL
jgi:hypothetical protein